MAAGRKNHLRVLRGYDVPSEARGFAAVITLIRLYGRFGDAMAKLVKPHGLTAPHFEVLLCLRAGEGISQQELSERLLMTKGNACVILQKMESAGLVERRTDPVDQRFHRLYMTDQGRRLLAQIAPAHHRNLSRVLGALKPVEQKTLHELLLRLEQAFDEEGD